MDSDTYASSKRGDPPVSMHPTGTGSNDQQSSMSTRDNANPLVRMAPRSGRLYRSLKNRHESKKPKVKHDNTHGERNRCGLHLLALDDITIIHQGYIRSWVER